MWLFDVYSTALLPARCNSRNLNVRRSFELYYQRIMHAKSPRAVLYIVATFRQGILYPLFLDAFESQRSNVLLTRKVIVAEKQGGKNSVRAVT